MGLAALAAGSSTGCRFDLDALRSQDGIVTPGNDGTLDGMVADAKIDARPRDAPFDGPTYDAAKDATAPDAGADAVAADVIADVAADAVMSDGLLFPDAGLIPPPDAGADALYSTDAFPADAASPDGSPDGGVSPCYTNDFNEDTSLADLVVQEGIWLRDSDGYLKRTDEENPPSWRKAYVVGNNFSNLDAIVKIRMIDSSLPGAGVGGNHAGILLRYNPQNGTGYVAQLQYSDNDTVQVSLDDFATGQNLQYATIDCGDIGCGYGTWYALRARMEGDNFRVYLNGVERLNVTNSAYTTGTVGFASFSQGESQYDDLQVCPPGELAPSIPYPEDDFCLLLAHFDLPNYASQECGSELNLTDNATTATESLSGFGEGRFFSGSSSMSWGANTTTEIIDRLTIEMLVKPAQASQSFVGDFGNLVAQIDSCATGNNYCGFSVQIYGDNHVGATLGRNEGNFTLVEGSTFLPMGTWSHVAFTYNGSVLRLYVNGYLDAELSATGFMARATTAPFTIGTSSGQNNSFIGSIDELRVSNVVRLGKGRCGYQNGFNEQADLVDLVAQSGEWGIYMEGDGYNNSWSNLKQSQFCNPPSYCLSYLDNAIYNDLDVTLRVRPPQTNAAFTGLLFRYSPASQFGYIIGIGNSNGSVLQFALRDTSSPEPFFDAISSVTVPGDPNSWYTIRVKAVGSEIKAYFNGGEVFTVYDGTYTSGYVGFGNQEGEGNFDALEICPTEPE